MRIQPLQQVLKQRMDRKQFLQTVGLMVLVVIGLSFLVKQQRTSSVAKQAPQHNNDTYGS